MPDSALVLVDLLRELGFDSAATAERARQILIEHRLSVPSKLRIAAEKRPKVEELLRGLFLVTCGSPGCVREAQGRELLQAHDRALCWVCHGSDNRRAVEVAAAALKRAGIRKIVIVGGSPAVHEELRHLAPADWELRLIDGTLRRTSDAARADLRWADLVLIWGGSELDHKVSGLYTGSTERARVVLVSRRGIAALMDGALRAATRS